MAFLKMALLLAMTATIASGATSDGSVRVTGCGEDLNYAGPWDYNSHTEGDQGLLCLDDNCVGYAKTQKGFLTFKKDALANFPTLPAGKKIAVDALSCYKGFCVGVNNNTPYLGYLTLNKGKGFEDIMKLDENVGFTCLNQKCVHVFGSYLSSLETMNKVMDLGLPVEMADKIEICSQYNCKSLKPDCHELFPDDY